MREIRNPDGTTTYVEKRGNGGLVLAVLVLAVALVVVVLFATGFWSADINGGSLPKVSVNATGGSVPDVNLHSKEIVVGTNKQTVTVPKVDTTTTTIDVPTVGVKDPKAAPAN